MLQSPFHIDEMNLRRISSLLQQDDSSLTGENRDSIMRDIMLSDLIGRVRERGAELHGPIQLTGVPINLLQLLTGNLGASLIGGD